jgi:quercetin dioxygenase-like cupin family protein
MLKIIDLIFCKRLNNRSCILTFFATLSVISVSAWADENDTQQTKRTSFSEIKWKDLPGGRGLAHVKGDFTKGAHIKLIKFSAGNKTPLHTHSHSYTGIVVKGVARHYEPNNPETETTLPAGSFWSVPANVPHISECLLGSECIFATQSDGAFDVKPVN